MLTLPLPIFAFVLSAVACALVWRLDIGNSRARGFFTAACAVIALGALLTGMRFGYGLEQIIAIQRTAPILKGPLIYLGFAALTRPAISFRHLAALHLSITGLAALLPQLIPALRPGLDLLIVLSDLTYASLLLWLWRQGSDRLIYASLEAVRGLWHWMLGSAAILAVSLVFNTWIAISFAMQRPDNAVELISYGSVLLVLVAIFAIVVFSRRKEGYSQSNGQSVAQANGRAPRPEVEDGSVELEQAARALLMQSQLYLDKDLTLDRLAKHLHVPARSLSKAINQTQHMNLSKYVNGFRAEHAAGLLATSALSVTAITDQSGFMSRSNFYREFERVYGLSPSAYREKQLPGTVSSSREV